MPWQPKLRGMRSEWFVRRNLFSNGDSGSSTAISAAFDISYVSQGSGATPTSNQPLADGEPA